MTGNVIVYTQVFNGAKTLRRTIESVLSQTYSDFLYYIADCDSTDETGSIIAEYALRDSRIQPCRHSDSGFHHYIDDLTKICKKYQDGYWAMLDADDEYTPDFLEKMLVFINTNNLDVAVCGSDYIDEETYDFISARKEDNSIIIEGTGFDLHFHVYMRHILTIWGKVYTLSLLRKCNFEHCKKIIFGADTMFAIEAFRNASKAGILADALHKYYCSDKSSTYRWYDSRIDSARILNDNVSAYLKEKCGYISTENGEHIQRVHLANIWQSLTVLLSVDIPAETVISGIHNIITCEKTMENTIWHEHPKAKKVLLSKISNWIDNRNVSFTDEYGVKLVEIFTAIDGFGRLCEKSPLLKVLQPQSAAFLSSAIAKILQNDLQAALDEVFKLAEDDIPDKYAENYLSLALNLCALVDYVDGWIMFSKEKVRYLIAQGRNDEAKSDLAELEELLPDDEELKELHKLINP
jgi:glycosyltransferase involved in cell wall biosynthesis